jgi:glycine hydroxymethyltransferase
MILDLRKIRISGMEAETLLEKAGIIANRNAVIGDVSLFHPSGIRIGVPAVTTRGMKENEMKKISELIYRVLIKKEKPAIIKKEVKKLCRKFPIYQ